MKNRARTRFTFILSLILASSALFSCGGETKEASGTTASDTTSDAVTSELSIEDQRKLIDDELPEMDFGGDTFNITVNTFCQDGFISEELNGDVLSDAIYHRNKTVEDRFNVKLNFITGYYGDLASAVRASVTAGDDEYQLLTQHATTANGWVSAGILTNWYDINYIDFEKPWWSPSTREDLTYNGKAFFAVGDFSLTSIGRTFSIYYDKVYAESYQLPDMYQLVRDGKWTIDKLSELTKDVYTDLNNDGKRDFEDFYGYSTATSSPCAFLFTSGVKIIHDGELVLDVERTADVISKAISLCRVNQGTFYDLKYKNAAGNDNYAGIEKMAEGTTLFATALLESGITYLRDYENDYGILPYPKFNEEQSDYIQFVDGGVTIMAIPKTVVDTDRAGIIAEALCAETYKNVIPIYYETVLKTKGARDKESIEMIDFIISKRVFDFGFVFDGWKGFGFVVNYCVMANDPNFASYYAKNINRVTAHYNEILACFE